MPKERKVPAWIGASLIVGAFGLFAWMERRRPLRRTVESKLRREARNLTFAAVSAVALRITEKPANDALTSLVERRRVGLLKLFKLPGWLEIPLAIILLDYTLYLWHVLTHRVPFLWRFHIVHHADLDLDVSTSVRFHFGELLVSIPWRAAQILFIGVSPLALSIWQNFVFLSIMFHHSNVELPIELERRLNRVFVTPRMHGIHHSIVEDETNSNWSSGFTIWDRLHKTLHLGVPQSKIIIGVPAYRNANEIGLKCLLAIPFEEQRPSWQLPDAGKPERELPPAVNELTQ